MKKRMKRLAAVGLVTVMTGTMLLGCGGEAEVTAKATQPATEK